MPTCLSSEVNLAFGGQCGGLMWALCALAVDAKRPDLRGRRPWDVSVVILEPTLESWGIRGGHSAADVELGFSLDV
jgi:hypothetical protein